MSEPLPSPDDWALINRLQRSAFGYFDDHTNPENGLVADNSGPDAPASIAAVGFALTALPVAVSHGWLSREAACARALAAVRFFHRPATDTTIGRRGFFYHFLHMVTGERVWESEISLIDTAILCLGFTAAHSFFDADTPSETELRERADAVIARIDWSWMLDGEHRLRMGWKPETGFLRHRWSGYSEALLAFAPGLGADDHALTADSYRNWRASFRWTGGDAPWAYAGPLFVHLFAHVWFDLADVDARPGVSYVENSRRAIRAQSAYAAENPHGFYGYNQAVWGFSASPGPQRRSTIHDGRRRYIRGYLARGAPYGPDDGTLTPWAALACLPLTPDLSRRSLLALLERFPDVLVNDRFCDAFNPGVRGHFPNGWFSRRHTALDQGLIVAMVENARSGLIHRLMARSPQIKRGLSLIAEIS